MWRRLLLRTAVVSVLVAVAVSMAVVVASGGGDGGTTGTTGPVAQPASSLSPIGPSGRRWTRGTQPLVAVKHPSQGNNTNCPKRTRSRRLPAGFPASFPLPKGTVLTDVQRPTTPGVLPRLYVVGHAPLSLRGASLFFIRELPLRGYYITASEAEAAEAEAAFAGPAKGTFKVLAIPRCSKRVWLLVGVTKHRRAASG